jgi:hypothetical protein
LAISCLPVSWFPSLQAFANTLILFYLAKDVEPYADWEPEVNNKDRCLALTGREPGKYIMKKPFYL